MSHVVISYSREDASFVDVLVTRLQAAGIAVWIDRDGVRSGDWERKIEDAIQRAGDFVLVVSPQSKASSRVRDEFHHARRWLDDEHIHPVILEEVPWMGIERFQQHYPSGGDVPVTLMRILGARFERDEAAGPTEAGEHPEPVQAPAGSRSPGAGAPPVVSPVSHVRSEAAEGFTTDGRWSERAFAETLDKGATSVVFTPDGSHLVASGPGGDVGIWSVETRQLLKKKLIHASMPSGTAVSFDGTRAAISYLTGQVRLIRLPGLGDGKLRDPKRMDGIASAVEFSRVQPHLAIGGPGLVKVWDWQAERDLGTLERHSETVHSISFDASPGSIVTCDSECAHVWDSISLRHIRAIRPTVGPAEMVMSVDGVLAAFRTIGGGVEVYEFESGELVSRSKHSGDWAGVSAFAFTRDGQLLSADSQGGLHLWNPQNLVAGEAVGIHPGKAHVVTCSPVEDIVVSCARRKRLGLVGDDYPRFWYRRPNATTGLEPDA